MGAQVGIVIAWIIAHYLPDAYSCTFLGISTCLLFFLYLVYLLARRPIIIPIELYVVVISPGIIVQALYRNSAVECLDDVRTALHHLRRRGARVARAPPAGPPCSVPRLHQQLSPCTRSFCAMVCVLHDRWESERPERRIQICSLKII